MPPGGASHSLLRSSLRNLHRSWTPTRVLLSRETLFMWLFLFLK